MLQQLPCDIQCDRALARIVGMAKYRGDNERNRAARQRKHRDVSHSGPGQSKSVNLLKTKIRDTARLLAHADNLPAGIRIEKERALTGYKQDLEDAIREKQKQKMIGKYHKVRFFERQKATRNLKKLKRRLESTQIEYEEALSLRESIQIAEVDLNYTIYYPLTEKYISLFPNEKSGESPQASDNAPADGFSHNGKHSRTSIMWNVVNTSMQEGNLGMLRDGKLSSRYTVKDVHEQGRLPPRHDHTKMPNGNRPSKYKDAKKVNAMKDRKPQAASKDHKGMGNEDSDGGFFET